jgi:shikimate kinase
MIIVVVGYTGSNKINIAKKIANKLDLNFFDLHQLIEKEEKISIPKMLINKGDVIFRKIENNYLKNLIKNKIKFVLSLEEGTPCYSNNIKLITGKNIVSIYLKYSINNLADILFKKPPIILRNFSKDKLKEYVAKHIFERNSYYKKSKIIIDCDQKSEAMIIKEILIKLNN